MFKIFAIVFLSWAAAVQAQVVDLPAEVAAILPTPRMHTVAHFDNDKNIFIMGGSDQFNLHHEVLKYDITKFGRVEEVGYFPTGIAEGALGVDTMGNFFYLGGDNGNDKSTTAWKVNPLLPTPYTVGDFELLNRLSCSVSDGLGNVFLIGGAVGTLETKRNIVKFDTNTKTATVVAQLPIGKEGTACAWLDGSIYIFGGLTTTSQYSTEIMKFTPATNELTVHAVPLDVALLHASAVTVGNEIYIVGGTNAGEAVHHVTKFNPLTNTLSYFQLPTHLNTIIAGMSTVFVPETSRIYVVGGYTMANGRITPMDQVFHIQLTL